VINVAGNVTAVTEVNKTVVSLKQNRDRSMILRGAGTKTIKIFLTNKH
jgi:hypothetical protein